MKKKLCLVIAILFSMFIFTNNVSAKSISDVTPVVLSNTVVKALDGNKEEVIFDMDKICDVNENPELVAGFRLGGIFLNIIKIVVPIIIIVLGMLDMGKAVLDGKDDMIKKQLMSLFKRAVACLLIFFIPSILLGIFHFVDGWDAVSSKYETCINCALGDSSCPEAGFGGHIKSDDELVEETKQRARDRAKEKANNNKNSGPAPKEMPQ